MQKEWLTANEAAKLLGYSDSATVNKLKHNKDVETKRGYRRTDLLYNREDLLEAYESLNHVNANDRYIAFPQFNTWRRLQAPQLILADAHCPFFDWELAEQLLRTRDKYKVVSLVFAGDFLNCAAQSSFYSMFPIPWKDEKAVARSVVKWAVNEFDSVLFLTANHELRYLRMLNAQYDAEVIRQDDGLSLDVWEVLFSRSLFADLDYDRDALSKVQFSIYPYCDVGERWRIVHPSSYRKVPLSMGRELCNIYGKSIVMAHAHMSAQAPAPNPKFTLIDTGIFANPSYFDYKNLKLTTHYQWSESYTLILDDQWGQVFMKGSPFI